jgi:hypothetical protein
VTSLPPSTPLGPQQEWLVFQNLPDDFFTAKPADFFKCWIENLPECWEAVMNNGEEYIID